MRYGTIAKVDASLRLTSTTWKEYARDRPAEWVRHLARRCGAPPRIASSAEKFKGWGIGHMSTSFAHLTLSHMIAQRGRRYFLASTTTPMTIGLIAVLCSMRCPSNDLPVYDYREALRLFRAMNEEGKANVERGNALAAAMLRDHTQWETKLP
jgi:hypothetical protein